MLDEKQPNVKTGFKFSSSYFLILGVFVVLAFLFIFWRPLEPKHVHSLSKFNSISRFTPYQNYSIEQFKFKIHSSDFPLSDVPKDYSALTNIELMTAQPENTIEDLLSHFLNTQYYENDGNYIEYTDIEPIEGENSEPVIIEYIIAPKDSLNKILMTSYKVKNRDVQMLLKINKNLSNLQPGQTIRFKMDDDNNLLFFQIDISKNRRLTYERANDDFLEVIQENKGVWRDYTISGSISSSLGKDGREVGLTGAEISKIEQILPQIDFKKIQEGDQFTVISSREMVNDAVHQFKIKAIKLTHRNKDYYAFLASNQRYYDESGNGLALGFRKYPLESTPRISSKFNPRRLHPVTGKVSPHNGVDFAVSKSTPVLAPADGEVIVAQSSPSAGKYITIRHNAQYVTRYMHNDQLLVKVGDHVTKDQVIAKSGNTGRSTGPHLHYEVHINGKPVDPMTAQLPKTIGLSGKEMNDFLQSIATYKDRLDTTAKKMKSK